MLKRFVLLVGPDALIGPFPGGTVCRLYKEEAETCPLIRLAFGQPPSPQGEGLRFCIGGPLGTPAVNGQSIVGSSKPGAGVEPHSS